MIFVHLFLYVNGCHTHKCSCIYISFLNPTRSLVEISADIYTSHSIRPEKLTAFASLRCSWVTQEQCTCLQEPNKTNYIFYCPSPYNHLYSTQNPSAWNISVLCDGQRSTFSHINLDEILKCYLKCILTFRKNVFKMVVI